MSDTTATPPVKGYLDHVADIQTWLKTTADNAVNNPELRAWCTLGIPNTLTALDIYNYFDNSQVNQDFQTEYDNVNGPSGTFTNTPIMYNQMESDNQDANSKMCICRHKTRLTTYRDDIENKDIRTYSSLSLSSSRYKLLQKVNLSGCDTNGGAGTDVSDNTDPTSSNYNPLVPTY